MDSIKYEVIGEIRFANGNLHSRTSYGTFADKEQARQRCEAVQQHNDDPNEFIFVQSVEQEAIR
jgi:hypothetical protein